MVKGIKDVLGGIDAVIPGGIYGAEELIIGGIDETSCCGGGGGGAVA